MDYRIILISIFLVIIISIQYTLNKILIELRDIKKTLLQKKIKWNKSRWKFVKFLFAQIDNIYELYSGASYEIIENDIIDSVTLLIMKNHGIQDKELIELRKGELLYVYDCKAYSVLAYKDLSNLWKNELLLPIIYEYILSKKKDKKKKFGIYYSPQWIVEYMVKDLLDKNKFKNKLKDIKILEPACGCGVFLLILFDYLFELYLEEKKYDIEQICKLIIENNLFGVDIDKKAIDISKNLLLIKTYKITGKINDYDYNLLVDNFLSLNKFNNSYFDLIIGNPPFLENRSLNKYYNKKILKEKYITAVGRFDIYSLFIENSIYYLKEGGYLSFILPGNLLSNNNFSTIRKYIIENTSICNIVNLGEGIFRDVGMNMIIFSLYKVIDQNNTINCKNISKSENKENDIKEYKFKKIPQKLYEKTLLNVFDIDSSLETFKLREKIFDSCELKVKDIADVVAGIATGNVRGKLITRNQNHPKAKKVLEGKNVTRFYHEWSGLYFIDDKSLIHSEKGEYATFMRRDMIENEKIIIRQTADRFICSYDNNGYYILNTLYSLVLSNNYKEQINIKYLLGLLNSKLFFYLYSSLIRERGKLFPQLKIFHIQHSPIKIPHKEIQNEIVSVVDEIISLNNNAHMEKNSKNEQVYKNRIKMLDTLLDNMIFDIYELTKNEIQLIKNELN